MSLTTSSETDSPLDNKAETNRADAHIAWVCPLCRGVLSASDANGLGSSLECAPCQRTYGLRGKQPDFRLDVALPDSVHENLDDTEQFQNRLKLFLRQSPWLYRLLFYAIGPALQLAISSQRFVDEMGPEARTLSIGAGVLRLRGNVTHLDYEPYAHLEVVGDAHYLPFPDNAFDGVVCETMLEHVLEPERVIAEMHRVLKPGGKCYVLMPFIFGFHAAPSDFYRYTHKGLLHRMAAFETEQLKVSSGPTSALITILMEWLALVFSFGSQRLYQLLALVFMVLLSPLKLLDFLLVHHPEAMRIASVMLYIGRKKSTDDLGLEQ